MTKLVFSPPGPDTPGYLMRQRKSMGFIQAIQSNPSPDTIDQMVSFLLDYVKEPADRKEATKALYMATEAEFWQLLNAVMGTVDGAGNPTPSPDESATKSD